MNPLVLVFHAVLSTAGALGGFTFALWPVLGLQRRSTDE
jgi:hypothetical protein